MSKADRLVTAVIIDKVVAHGEMQTAARRMAAGILRPFGYRHLGLASATKSGAEINQYVFRECIPPSSDPPIMRFYRLRRHGNCSPDLWIRPVDIAVLSVNSRP
jgi:hypothetical protein